MMPPTLHAQLGASSAHRWMACPGSIRLSREAPEQPTSEYALKGSAAHELAERCVSEGYDAEDAIGIEIVVQRKEEKYPVQVDRDMAEAVQVYLDYVRSIFQKTKDSVHKIEVRFSLEDLDPPGPMFGTADAVAWNPETRTLDVVDYKHGRGVVVEVVDNPQLMYYALGAVLDLRVKPDTIRVTIVQPRADHPDGSIRTWSFDWETLVSFKEELMEAAEAAADPEAPVGPTGDHCRFCPAKAICPAQQENMTTLAQTAFDVENVEWTPPAKLPKEKMLLLLDLAPEIEDYIKEVRSFVKRRLEEGGDLPGWKLVEKRKYRRWEDDEEAEEWLRARFNKSEVIKEKLVSPYQAEQLLEDRPRTEIPEGMIVAKSSGFNLAPEDNPRPAVTPALLVADEFGVETSGSFVESYPAKRPGR